jgi:hypothetical protein
MKGTPLGTNPNPLFEDGQGPGLEPVGSEFQPSFETVHPGGGAHFFFVLHSIFVLNCDLVLSISTGTASGTTATTGTATPSGTTTGTAA